MPAPAMFKPLPSGTADISAQQLLADRLGFVKDMYQLNAEQTGKIRPLLEKLAPEQDQYNAKSRLTLRRMRLAISVVANEPPSPEADLAGTMGTLQSQIGDIHAAAPLSLANVMRLVEPQLPKEQVDAARTRIRTDLAARLKRDTAAIDVAKIDQLLMPTVAPEPLPTVPGVPPPTVKTPPQPIPLEPASPQSTPAAPTSPVATTQPATPPPPKTPPTPPPPPSEPPKVLQPAPPEAEWTKQYEATATKYGLTADQKKIAENAVKSCLDRAAAYREKNKGTYEKAQAIKDTPEKEAALKKLSEPIDRLYDEMRQRIDSIATIEQRLRGEGKLPTSRPVAPAPPASPAPLAKPTTMPAQPPPKPLPVPPPTTQPAPK